MVRRDDRQQETIVNSETTEAGPFDPARRFVRVTGVNAHGFIEFEFAVGGPELFVELMLPAAAFDAFCRTQNATRLDRPIMNSRSRQ